MIPRTLVRSRTRLFGLAFLLGVVPLAATARDATVMEIVSFEAQEGATPDAITDALAPIAEKKMGRYGTLIARSVAEGPDGAWTMVNFRTDRAAMNRINEEALEWPEFGALPGVADLETLQMRQLDIAVSIGLASE